MKLVSDLMLSSTLSSRKPQCPHDLLFYSFKIRQVATSMDFNLSNLNHQTEQLIFNYLFLTFPVCYASLTQLIAFYHSHSLTKCCTKTTRGEAVDYTQLGFLNLLSKHHLDRVSEGSQKGALRVFQVLEAELSHKVVLGQKLVSKIWAGIG